jgi:hypothetical protein
MRRDRLTGFADGGAKARYCDNKGEGYDWRSGTNAKSRCFVFQAWILPTERPYRPGMSPALFGLE